MEVTHCKLRAMLILLFTGIVKVRTLDIAPLRESSPQNRSGMARVLKDLTVYLHTHTFNPLSE